MEKNQTLDIQLIDLGGNPLSVEDVFVDVTFFMKGKVRYGFRFGPTDTGGRLQITYQDVDAKRLRKLEFQPWDFKSMPEDCDSRIVISVPSAEKLKWASEVATSFKRGETPDWAKDWLKGNNVRIHAEEVAVELLEVHTRAKVPSSLIDDSSS